MSLQIITDRVNLQFAWRKLLNDIHHGDFWMDPIEIARFELNLEEEFKSIQHDVRAGTYKLADLVPLAYPKMATAEGPKSRQAFTVSIRDQLLWIAVVNVIGPAIDIKMPFWSYGNRLYRSIWPEVTENEKRVTWVHGAYSHSSGRIFRNWSQSWPKYRRHIATTVKVMYRLMDRSSSSAGNELQGWAEEALEAEERDEFVSNSELPGELQVKYWDSSFWNLSGSGDVYWASFDLKQFYPSVGCDEVFNALKKHGDIEDPDVLNLLRHLLDFRVRLDEWTHDELEEIGLNGDIGFNRLPTGLSVAGFLANVAVLDIDLITQKYLEEKRNIAHFRFVDDHVVLSSSFESLVGWISEYERVIGISCESLRLNKDKTEPEALRKFLDTEEKEISNKDNAASATKLDRNFPTPLLTQTLTKVSTIGRTEFDLLSDQEEEMLISDLEHLMLSDLPEHEIRRDTRVSFSAAVLSKIVPRRIGNTQGLIDLLNSKELLESTIRQTERDRKINTDKERAAILLQKIQMMNEDLSLYAEGIERERRAISEERRVTQARIFNLLIRALSENYSKARVWRRVIDYIANTGYEGLPGLFEFMRHLVASRKCTILTYQAILTTVVQQIAERAITSVKYLCLPDSSVSKFHSADRFLKHLSKFDLYSYIRLDYEVKLPLRQTLFLYELNVLSIHLILSNRYSGFNYSNVADGFRYLAFNEVRDDVEKFIFRYVHDYIAYLWYLISRNYEVWPKGNNPFWIAFRDCIKGMDLPTMNLLGLYPKELDERILERIDSIDMKVHSFANNVGWMNDIRVFPVDNPEGYIPLTSWVEEISVLKSNLLNSSEIEQFPFDVRTSEWMALCICREVINGILKAPPMLKKGLMITSDNSYLNNIHPANFLISDSILRAKDFSWNDMKVIISKPGLIKLVDRDKWIKDNRYTFTNSSFRKMEFNQAQGICALLVGMLTLSFDFPFAWHIRMTHGELTRSILNKIESVSVSSYTRSIIEACYSKFPVEKSMVSRTQLKLFGSDGLKPQSLEILNIQDLLKCIETAIHNLEKYQISVGEGKPRQLVPVDLLQLSNSRMGSRNVQVNSEGNELF